MSRLPRIQFPGAFYHVTSRGNRRANIYVTERDYCDWVNTLGAAATKYNFVVHAYCQMPNHFHLVIQTTDANLARGMQHLNSTYCQDFNQRHNLSGHVMQGRYHALLIEKESQLLATVRYVERNPVRATLVPHPADWNWSSHRAMLGLAEAPAWLASDWLLSQFGTGPRMDRARAYSSFVLAGADLPDPLEALYKPQASQQTNAPPPAATLQEFSLRYPDYRDAIRQAYRCGVYTQADIARYFKVSQRTVTRLIRDRRSK